MYVITYTKNQQYFNITGYGLDVFNIGLNPKLYKTVEDAQKDVDQFDELKHKQLMVLARGEDSLDEIKKPSWYEERHGRKLTKREASALDWYESAKEKNAKRISFFESLSKDQLQIQEYDQ